MLAVVAVVCEALTSVSEQISRRSYGAFSLQMTLTVWENLRRQLRVILLLKSRQDVLCDGRCVASVHDLGIVNHSATDIEKARSTSIYRVLAMDTLSFTTRADHAVDHESHCREEHNRNMLCNGRDEYVLNSWGSGADANWRDLFSSISASPSSAGDETDSHGTLKSQMIARAPLLIVFPFHNQPSILGAYRALELSVRYVRFLLSQPICESSLGVRNSTLGVCTF